MRIKPSTSFPHPVLSGSTGDFGKHQLHLTLEVTETPSIGGAILKGVMALDDQSVRSLIDLGCATPGLMINCQETYLDCFKECAIGDLALDLSGGTLRGTVRVRAAVIATQDDVKLESEYIDAEFPPSARIVHVGDVIAMSEELNFEAGLEKLAPLESIFHLKKSNDVAEDSFIVDLESESIDIVVSPALYDMLYNLRRTAMKDMLLSALYLPVVMEVLEAMRTPAYVDRRWHSVFRARSNNEGIDIEHGDLAKSAQLLLDAPLGTLKPVLNKVA